MRSSVVGLMIARLWRVCGALSLLDYEYPEHSTLSYAVRFNCLSCSVFRLGFGLLEFGEV